jgi:methionyl-tRNA formyltransferase
LDAGPILAKAATSIGPRETSGELEARLAELGAPPAIAVIDRIEAGTAVGLPQDATQASKAPRLKKEHGRIDWSRSPQEIDRHVRAMQPWPLAESFLVRRPPAGPARPPLRVIVLEVAAAAGDVPSAIPVEPGTVLDADERLLVRAGGGGVEIVRLRPEGKRDMTAADFLRGYPVEPGDRFETGG